MYSTLLTGHSILRWLVVAAGLFAAFTSWRSVWRPTFRRPGLAFVTLIDLQVTLGLVLYFFLSPLITAGFREPGAIMSNGVMRFWVVEHPFGMLVALALGHLARRVTLDPALDTRGQRKSAILFTAAIVIVLLSIPWPFLSYGRPLR